MLEISKCSRKQIGINTIFIIVNLLLFELITSFDEDGCFTFSITIYLNKKCFNLLSYFSDSLLGNTNIEILKFTVLDICDAFHSTTMKEISLFDNHFLFFN